jgi:peptide/nickel transport system permease protein
MGRFIVRRALFGILVLAIISFAVFLLFFVVAPGDKAGNFCGKNCTPERLAQIRALYHLDQPWYDQYVLYVKRLVLHGDLGFSFTNQTPVRDIIFDRAPITASLALGAAVVWLSMGIPIGILAATKPRSLRDRAATTFALAGLSIPTFVLGLVFLYVFFYQLTVHGAGFFPGNGYVPLTENPWDWAKHLILPWFTLAVVSAASYSRITRGSLLEVLGEDYIRTARAKGLSERRVIYRHGLRSALTPVVTLLGIDVGTLLGGAIVTEAVFGLQGIGQTAVQAVTTGDLPIIFGTVMFAAFFVVIGNLVVDLVYAMLDVRVRAA